VNHGAEKAKISDTALEFVHCAVRIRHGQGAERQKPVRVRGDCLCHPVVDLSAHRDGCRGREVLHIVAECGEHLHIDAGVVHDLDAPLTHLVELGGPLARAQADVDARGLDDVPWQDVLL
jgi:hypothetical protein